MNKQDHCFDFSTVAAIVPAGGCGQLHEGIPKIHEMLPNGRSIIGQILQTLREIGFAQIVVVVNNYLFQKQTEEHLRGEGFENHITYGFQEQRTGAAKAVEIGLQKLDDRIDTVLVTYADMPLWSPATIASFLWLHRFSFVPLSLVSVPLTHGTPAAIRKFGRLLRNEKGHIMQVIERSDFIDPEEAKKVTSVNPSLYVFNREWLAQNLGKIQPTPPRDGFPAEHHLPPLIQIARKAGASIAELEITNAEEALGVNTLQDLSEVSAVFERRVRQMAEEAI